MTEEYDVKYETEFSREKLSTAIPKRLDELLTIVEEREANIESWYAQLIKKILLSVDRSCRDLLGTMELENVPLVAWNARNILELWVWIKYCGASRENSRRFFDDALRDMAGLTDALSEMSRVMNTANKFEASARESITDVAKQYGVDMDVSYARVANAAELLGLSLYAPMNKFLSKFAHPTAGLVIGIMHQMEHFCDLQATLTTKGLFFAGQCVIALEEIVLNIPANLASAEPHPS